jgi:hypothetical protein
LLSKCILYRYNTDLADVANRMKENTSSVNKTLRGNVTETKKMEETMVKAIEAQGYRIERIEGAIEGLHRVLQSMAANGGGGGGGGRGGGSEAGSRWGQVQAAQEVGLVQVEFS